MQGGLDIQRIMAFLPQRYPFVFVDRVETLIPGERIVAIKNVTLNEPFFQGHFPGRPIMPGVLILEALGQAGEILACQSLKDKAENEIVYLMGMDRVRFRKPVIPGDQLVLDVRMLRQRGKVFKMAGKAAVQETLVAEAELMATFGDKP